MDGTVRLEESWKQALSKEFDSAYMGTLKSFLQAEKQAGKHPQGIGIFPGAGPDAAG